MESEILGFLFSYGCSYTVGAEAEREVLQTLLQKRRKLLGQEELEVSPQVGSFETAEKGAGFRRGKVAQQQALGSATSTSSSSPVAATELATAGDTTNAGTSEDSVAEQQEASSTASTAEVAPDGGETEAAARKARLAKVPHIHLVS